MARYDRAREKNKTRDERIKRFYFLNPDMALQEIADMFNLNSRQHVFYIVKGKRKASL